MSEDDPAQREGPSSEDAGQETVVQPATHEAIPRAGAWAPWVGGLVPLVIGVLCLVYSISLGVGTPTRPGPGMWPLAASLALLIASVVLLIFERGREDYEQFTRGAWLVVLGVLSLGVFVVLFDVVGFQIPTLLLFVFWLKFLGGESWRTTLIISMLSTIGFYVLFVTVLGIPLPRLTF